MKKNPTILSWMLAAIVLLTACAAPEADGLLLRNVNIVNVEAKKIDRGKDVLIRNGRIAQIAESGAISGYSDSFDAGGAYATAGLIDAHVHIDTAARLELMLPDLFGVRVSDAEIDDDLVPYMTYGVTGVVVFNGIEGVLAARARANEAGEFMPRILTAGPILDGPDSSNPLHRKIATPEEGVAAVDDAAAKGYDFIKTYHIEDVNTRNAIIARALELGLPVAGHIPPGMSFEDAIIPGFSNIAHAEEITRLWDGKDPAYLARAIALMAENNVSLTPNLVAYREIADEISDIDGHLAELDWALTPPLARVYASPPFNGYVNDFGGDMRDRAAAYFRRIAAAMDGLALDAHRAGVLLLAGTDAGNPTMLPGQGLYRELALLKGAGLDGYDALAAATINVARLFGEEAERGSVAEGKIADIILFRVNPVEQEMLSRADVVAVVKDGFVFDRARIAEEIARVSAEYDRREAGYVETLNAGRVAEGEPDQ